MPQGEKRVEGGGRDWEACSVLGWPHSVGVGSPFVFDDGEQWGCPQLPVLIFFSVQIFAGGSPLLMLSILGQWPRLISGGLPERSADGTAGSRIFAALNEK